MERPRQPKLYVPVGAPGDGSNLDTTADERAIDAFAHRFNHTRPHQALGDLTPAEYLSTITQEIAQSHMG